MHFINLRSARRATLTVCAVLSGLFATVASAVEAKEVSSAPPAFTDAAHVMNGCYISTTAYLARFHAEFPSETGAPIAVQPKNYEMAHTVALVSWKGSWWVRDEYFGVFPLGSRVKGEGLPVGIEKKASLVIEEFTSAQIASGEVDANVVQRQLAASKQSGEIATAASLLPLNTEQFTIDSAGKKISFLFFRPADGLIAVYSPTIGTALAKCASHAKSAAIVASFVANLGFKVDAVHAEILASAPTIVAGSVRVASLQ